jgi:thymidylate synthase (FAD)
MGVCKEQARMVLPVSLYSECYWTCSLQAVMHFISLRDEEHAQWEIQEYARGVKELIRPLFPHTLELFDKGTK